jgi:hypothetical protein
MRTTKVLSATSDGVGGFNDITISPLSIGYKLSETNRSAQLYVKGLDGGSYAVYIKPIDNEDWYVFEPEVTEVDIVSIPANAVMFDEVLIQFLSLGAGASPACTFTSFVKGF